MSGGDDLLMELFREEVRANTQALSEGLVALEHQSPTAERLAAMMRAAHSMKGAARVVNLQPGVEVAHAMEDCLVRAQKSELTITSELIDVLLACVDAIQEIARAAGPEFDAWRDSHRSDLDQLLRRLHDAAQTASASSLPADTATAASGSAPGAPAASTATAAAGALPARTEPAAPAPREPAPESRAEVVPLQCAVPGQTSAAQAEEAAVRVSARSLTRLTGLAGETLVEARWLQPFSKSLLELKRRQRQLAETLDGLADRAPSVAPGAASPLAKAESVERPVSAAPSAPELDRAAERLAEARAQMAACQELLADRMAEFDRRMRNTDDLSARLYREVISSRMRPFRDGVQGLPRLVRDLARQLGKRAQLEILGESTEVDRDILDQLDAPLNHLIRNALDHGLETPEQRTAAGKAEIGRLRIEATHSAGLLAITVSDDGRGIDLERLRGKVVERGYTTPDVAQRLSESELLDFLFLPGFSTAAAVTDVSGRGVGLDVVQTMVQTVGGRIQIQSERDRGACFRIELPVTLSVLRAVVVEIAGEPYAFPHTRIDRVLRIAREDLHSLENRQYFPVDGQNVGIVMARQVLQLDGPAPAGDELWVVLLSERTARYGLVVDGLRGEQDLVVRPVDRRLGKVPNVNSAAILDDGSPALIVDPDDLRRSIEKLLQADRPQRAAARAAAQPGRGQKRVLVVDDSITVREVQRQLLANQGYTVDVGVDGMEGWNLVREGRYDLVISDIDMPRMNGLELVRRIKADPRLQSLPVVIVSYKDRDEDRLHGLEAGANYYLTKSSFHDDTLIQAVRELIGDAEA